MFSRCRQGNVLKWLYGAFEHGPEGQNDLVSFHTCGQATMISDHMKICEMRRSIDETIGGFIDKRNSAFTQQVGVLLCALPLAEKLLKIE